MSAKTRTGLRIEGLPIIGVFLVLVALFIFLAPNVFLGYRIYMSFLATVPPVLVLALGLTLVIAAGEIDLSFPSVIAFSGFIFAFLFKTYELTWLAFATLQGHLGPHLAGKWQFLKSLPRTWSKRREIQRSRRVGDRELLVGGPAPELVLELRERPLDLAGA